MHVAGITPFGSTTARIRNQNRATPRTALNTSVSHILTLPTDSERAPLLLLVEAAFLADTEPDALVEEALDALVDDAGADVEVAPAVVGPRGAVDWPSISAWTDALNEPLMPLILFHTFPVSGNNHTCIR